MPICGKKCGNVCSCCNKGEAGTALLGEVKSQPKQRTWGDTGRSIASFFSSAANVTTTAVTHLVGVPIKGATFVPHYFYAKIFGGNFGGPSGSPTLESEKVKQGMWGVAATGMALGYIEEFFLYHRSVINSGKAIQIALLKDLLVCLKSQSELDNPNNAAVRLQRIKDTLTMLNSKDGIVLKSLEFTFKTLNNGAVLSGLTLLPFLAINALITPVYSEASDAGITAAITTGVFGGMSFAWKPIAQTRSLDAEIAQLINELDDQLKASGVVMTPTPKRTGSNVPPSSPLPSVKGGLMAVAAGDTAASPSQRARLL